MKPTDTQSAPQEEVVACTVIGGGVLGTCLVDGLLEQQQQSGRYRYHIRVTARRGDHAKQLRARYPGLLVVDDNRDAALWGDWRDLPGGRAPATHFVLVCTQPQFTRDVCADLSAVAARGGDGGGGGQWAGGPTPVFVTMCPGVSVAQLEAWLPAGAAVIRTMPNTPVSVHQGATAMFANGAASQRDVAAAAALFRHVSPTVSLLPEEELIDVAASVSGSGPAYVYVLMAALMEAGVERGLPRDLAAGLVKQSAFGAACLALQDKRPLQALIDDVCVPGGSTEKAMAVLVKAGFAGAVASAVEASLKANREMGQ